MELKTKEAKENRRTSQAREKARWNRRTSCSGGAPQPALASSLDLASIETLVRSPHLDHEGWLRWTYDTGAAISAFSLDARIGQKEIVNEPGAIRLYLEIGTYIGYTKIQQRVNTRSDQELCSMHAKQQSGEGLRHS